jgi:hypothetical protein
MPDEALQEPATERGEAVEERVNALYAVLGISELDYPQVLEDSVRHASAFPAPVPPDPTWRCIGPRNVGGRVLSLAQDPRDPLILYAGTAHGGLWRTLDGGDTWAPLGGPDHVFPVGTITVAEPAPGALFADTLYVGTGSLRAHHVSGRGIFRVTFAAHGSPAVFVRLAEPDPSHIPPSDATPGAALRYTRIRVDPDDPARFWAASQTGVWRHAPGPTPWVRDFPPPDGPPAGTALHSGPPVDGRWPNYATDLLVARDPRSSDTFTASDGRELRRYLVLYVGIDGVGVFRGRYDRRENQTGGWELLDVPNTDLYAGGRRFTRVGLALCRRQPQHVYAVFSSRPGGGILEHNHASFVYASDDSGSSWQQRQRIPRAFLYDGLAGGQAYYDLVLEVNPDKPAVLVCGEIDLCRSVDGGASWTPILRWDRFDDGDYAQHGDQHAALFDAGNHHALWAGNDGGISLARDLRLNPDARGFWRKRSHGIVAGQFQDVTASPTFPFMCGGGLQDNGAWLSFSGPTWYHVDGGDGGALAVDHANPRRYHITIQNELHVNSVVPALPPPLYVNPVVPEVAGGIGAMGVRAAAPGGAMAIPGAQNGRLSPFVPPLEQHPVAAGRLLLGWRSDRPANAIDEAYGVDWGAGTTTPINLGQGAGVFGSAVMWGPADALGNADAWVGTSNGNVFRSTAGLAGPWNAAGAIPWPAGAQPVSRIAVHPRDRRVVAASSSGTPGRVYVSYDAGASWVDATAEAPTAVAVTPANPAITVGRRLQLTARATYADGATLDVTATAAWASSAPATVAVSTTPGAEGQVTALATGGPATITATFGGQSGTTNVTVGAAVGAPDGPLPRPPRPPNTRSLPPAPVAGLCWDPVAPPPAGRAIPLYAGAVAGVYVLQVPDLVRLTISASAPEPVPLGHGQMRPFRCTGDFSDGTTRDLTTQVDWSFPAGELRATVSNTAGSQGQVTGGAVAAGVGEVVLTARRGPNGVRADHRVRIQAAAAAVAALPAGPAVGAPPVPARWRPFVNGLPLALVNDITTVAGPRLRIATFGRGVWDCELGPAPGALFLRQHIVDEGRTAGRANPPPIADDPRLPAGAVALNFYHAFDIRVDMPPYSFFEDRVDGVEFDESLAADQAVPLEKNFVYVQVHNHGTATLNGVQVHLFAAPVAAAAGASSTWGVGVPANAFAAVTEFYNAGFAPAAAASWQRVGTVQTIAQLRSGDPAVVRFDWTPAVALAGQEVGLVALCSGPGAEALPAAPPGPAPFTIDKLVLGERRAALRVVTVRAAAGPAIHIRDGVEDAGRLGAVAFSGRSPDIIVVQQDDGDARTRFRDLLDTRPQDRLKGGVRNVVYVRVHNRGRQPATAEVELWAVKLLPDGSPDHANWTRVSQPPAPPPPGAVPLTVAVPAGDWALARVEWTSPPDPNPAGPYRGYVLAALVSVGAADPRPDRARVDGAGFWDFFLRQADSENAASRAVRFDP